MWGFIVQRLFVGVFSHLSIVTPPNLREVSELRSGSCCVAGEGLTPVPLPLATLAAWIPLGMFVEMAQCLHGSVCP